MAKKKEGLSKAEREHLKLYERIAGQEARDIGEMVKAHKGVLKEAKRVSKMSPAERASYDKDFDRKMTVKIIKVGNKGLVKLMPKKPDEPSGADETRSQQLIKMLKRHKKMKRRKKLN